MNETWVEFINANIDDEAKRDNILQSVNWTLWVREPGYPPVIFNFSNPDQEVADQLAKDYIALGGMASPSNYQVYNTFYSNQRVIFLLYLINHAHEFNITLLQRIDIDLGISTENDPEVKQRWYPLGIAFHYDAVFEPAHTFVSVQGRMKYLNPIYQALCDYGYRSTAFKWFYENLDFYHPIAIQTLKGILLQQAYEPTEEDIKLIKKHELLLKYKRVRL